MTKVDNKILEALRDNFTPTELAVTYAYMQAGIRKRRLF